MVPLRWPRPLARLAEQVGIQTRTLLSVPTQCRGDLGVRRRMDSQHGRRSARGLHACAQAFAHGFPFFWSDASARHLVQPATHLHRPLLLGIGVAGAFETLDQLSRDLSTRGTLELESLPQYLGRPVNGHETS